MADPYYPTVDIQFVEDCIRNTGKLQESGVLKSGSTTNFILVGGQPLYKRIISVREMQPGQICFEQATGIAINLRFLSELGKWLEKNRKWKDGAYIV